MKIYTHDYPPEFSKALEQEDIDTIKQFLDNGIVDVRYNLLAFEAALDTVVIQSWRERPLDFKFPDLILAYGFQIKAYRSLLINYVCQEAELWHSDFCDGLYVPETPDILRSAYILKNGAELNFLSNKTKTALDYAIDGYQRIEHPKAEKALREAGAKRAAELSHEEFVLAHDLPRIIEWQNLNLADVYYYVQQRMPEIYELSEAMSRCCLYYAKAGSRFEPWEELIRFLCRQGARFRYRTLRNTSMAFNGIIGCIVYGAENQTAHQHTLQKIEFLLAQGANINEVSMAMTALDAAYQHQNQSAIALLRQHGAQTLAELQAEGRIRGQGHEMQLIPDNEANATP